jgi:beta-mannosidase
MFFAFSCGHVEKKFCFDIPIVTDWEFRILGQKDWLPAHIPGDIIADLQRNKIIENPFLNADAAKLAWIAKNDFEYRTVFDIDPEVLVQDSVQICFQSLETHADVYINDSLIFKAGHAISSPVVNCKSILQESDNSLRVYFHASLNKNKHSKTNCESPKYNYDVNFGSGLKTTLSNKLLLNANVIYNPVTIRAWSVARIDGLYLHPLQITKKNADYVAEFSIVSTIDQTVTLEFLVNNKLNQLPRSIMLKKGYNPQHITLSIKDPKLWWTKGLGNQNLYAVSVVIKKGQQIINKEYAKLGVRTVKVVSTEGSNSFRFQLNDIPIFIVGTHYFPCKNYAKKDTSGNCEEKIKQAVASNVNMIRIHEGNESDNELFYRLCDEQGILVWHDLSLPCPLPYKDTVRFQNIRRKTIETVIKLRNHPCISLWGANMEQADTDQVKNYFHQTSAKSLNIVQKFYCKLLPEAVKAYDKQSVFCLSYNADKGFHIKQNLMLFTDSLQYGPYTFNDFGMESFPSMSTIKMFISSMDMQIPDLSLHASTTETNALNLIYNNICNVYRKPKNYEILVYLSQIAQADAMKTVIEDSRCHIQNRSGLFYRQLNDSRPSISSSTVDYCGRYKPAYYAISDASASVLVIPAREHDYINIYAVSNFLKGMDAILLAKLIDFKGKSLYVKQIPVVMNPNTVTLLLSVKESEILKYADKAECCLIIQLNQPSKSLSNNIMYFTDPKDLHLSKTKINLDVSKTAKGVTLNLKSDMLAKNVWIETISKVSYCSDNNFDLLPDKKMKIEIRYPGTKDEFLKDLKIYTLADSY